MPRSSHVLLQPRAQRLRRFALAADSHRKMAAARKHPDVAFQVRQKLNVDVILRGRHIVAERGHGVGRGPLRADVAQRIARARGDDAEIRFGCPCRVLSRHPRPPRSIPSTRVFSIARRPVRRAPAASGSDPCANRSPEDCSSPYELPRPGGPPAGLMDDFLRYVILE